MKIKVNQVHIDNGEARNCERCPVALALQDAGLFEPSIGYSTLYAGVNRDEYEFPDVVGSKILAFDDGLGMEPFEFKIKKVR